jgi:hypothetical protein
LADQCCPLCIPTGSMYIQCILIRLFRIMFIPTTFHLFRVLTSEMLSRRLPVFTLLLWDFPCQCTQQKLQSICAVLTFDPQLKKNLNIFCKRQISIKLFSLYQRLQCRDNYFFKNNLYYSATGQRGHYILHMFVCLHTLPLDNLNSP